MPKIQPYTPQTNAGSLPTPETLRLDQAEGQGKGLESLGAAMETAGDRLQRSQNQSDLSKLNAKMALARADAATELHQKTQDGTLDTEEYKQSVQDRVDEISDSVQTRAGRDYFTAASAHLQGDMLNQAAVSQAALKGSEAKDNFLTSLNANTSTLMKDPHTYAEVKDQQMQGIDALVNSGGLPAKMAPKFKEHSQQALAEAAIRGYMEQDPEAIRDQLKAGTWDKEIDGNTKYKMIGETTQAVHAKSIEQMRVEKAARDALVLEQTKTQNDFLEKMTSGQLSTKDILHSNLDPFGSGSKEQFLNMIHKEATQKSKTDPYVYNDLFNRIHLPDGDPNKITDENQLNGFLGNGVDMPHLKSLRGEMQGKGTIEGDANAQLKKALVKDAYQKIAKPDPFTKLPDPQGAENYRAWLSDFSQKYQQGLKDGKKQQDMLANPKSPDYLGGNTDAFVRTPEQIINDMVKQKTPAAPAQEPMIDVVSPQGVSGKLPQSKIDAAKKQGYKVK